MSCVYDTHLESKRVRYSTMVIFILLYSGFTIMLGIRLNDWNDDSPGGCYITSTISKGTPPDTVQKYLGATSVYVCLCMVTVIMLCRRPSMRLYYQNNLFVMSTFLFILHVYTMVVLRIHNEPLLDNSAIENEWGFGQVVAIMMLAATLLECAKGFEGKLTFVEA